MSIPSILYTLIISPLELLLEVIFTVADKIIGNAGLSIIFLSIVVNFLVLPLYKRADELQAEERDIQAKMAYRIKRTKETFKGDERFMMLQEYYRINHYKPIYALKSSASLLLQIPFFIAAYRLLSGMQSLNGMQFGFISDLVQEGDLSDCENTNSGDGDGAVACNLTCVKHCDYGDDIQGTCVLNGGTASCSYSSECASPGEQPNYDCGDVKNGETTTSGGCIYTCQNGTLSRTGVVDGYVWNPNQGKCLKNVCGEGTPQKNTVDGVHYCRTYHLGAWTDWTVCS